MTSGSAFLVLSLVLGPTGGAAQALLPGGHERSSEREGTAVRGGPLDPALQGVWLSRGYGWLVVLGPDELALYDHGPAGSLRVDEELERTIAASAVFRREGEALSVGTGGEGATRYLFDRLEELPEGLHAPPASDPLSVFDYAWRIMDTHYAFFELHGVDWSARREALRPRVRPDMEERELFQLLTELLSGLRDDHLMLEASLAGEELRHAGGGPLRLLDPAVDAAFETQEEIRDRDRFWRHWLRLYRQNVEEMVLAGEARWEADGALVWGRIADIGYINVFGMGGFSEAEDPASEAEAVHALMSGVLEELADCSGMIVDVTLNSGGFDEVQLAIAGHFAYAEALAFTRFPADTDRVDPQSIHVRPAAGKRFLGPVSLVTSDYTVSAAETFTLAMRALPNVTHRGRRTRGAFSDMLVKRLPNGWSLSLSNEVYLDPDGNHWEGRGVPPDDPLDVFVEGSVEESHAWAILGIADKMRAGW